MSVGAKQVVCPACGETVDVTVGESRTAVDAGEGHVEDQDGVVNQLCTACVEAIHVRVE